MTPQELKNSILQLAIQGKLVEQRPEEGTAAALFAQIQAEKQALIRDGKLKKEKPLPEITEEEVPFDIPESWMWVRLQDLCSLISDGTHKTPTYVEKGVPFLSVKDISGGFMDFSHTRFISQNEHQTLIQRCHPEKDDVLICRIGTLGKAIRIDTDKEFSIFVSLGLIKLIKKEIANYIVLAINSGYGFSWIQRVKVGGGTHTFKINLDDLRLMPIPLPPFSEQERIIEKSDSFSDYFLRYKKAWSRLEDFNKRFPGDMQKSILQMAIQGKLVEQRPEEGTGEELYRRIQAEKQSLIQSGKLKKQKPLPEITEDEIPFDIPESWKWVRVGNVGSWSAGATPSRTNSDYYGGPIPWLKTGDLNDDVVTVVPEFITQIALEKTSVRLNPAGSVLMAMYGATIGKLGIAGIPLTTNQACCACIPFAGIYNRYLFYYLMAMRTAFVKMGEGGAQPNISKEKIVSSLLPLPPLAEQKRIVTCLEELLPLCEKLK